MKKRFHDFVFAFMTLVVVWGAMFSVDAFRASQRQNPIFCVKIYTTGAYQYRIGLFYGVYEHYNDYICPADSCPIITEPTEYTVSLWFVQFS
ncbi:MAG: hypothetical protein NTV44_01800 [Firmicutes bacterium]|nr:hypothetical protein [Bacillota bacterium]